MLPVLARTSLLAALLAVAAAPGAAEEPPAAEPARPGFIDTVEVNQVEVEVVVTGRRGRRILDLGRDDFELFEDGRRVEISHFRGPGSVEAARRPPGPSAPAAGPGEPELAPPAPEPPSHLLLFVDTLSLRPRHRRELFEALRKALSREPEGLRLMLVTFDGRLRVRHGFGSATPEVLTTLAKLERGRLSPTGESDRQAAELAAAAAELEAAQGGAQLEAARARRDSALAEIRASAEAERAEILNKVDLLRQLAFSLGGLAGRKSILYAGDQLTMAPGSDLYAAADSAFGGTGEPGGVGAPSSGRLDLYRDFQGLVLQANATGVSFHTITPPSQQHLGDVTLGSAGPAGFQGAIRREREDRIKEAACLMSNATGGRCQSGGSNPRLLIDATLEDLGSVYSLGYLRDRPSDGRYHRIEVRVKRRGLDTRHREGYVDRTVDDRLRERLAAALRFDAVRDELGVGITIGAQTPLGKRRRFRVPIEVEVPAERLALLPSGDSDVLAASGRILVSTAAPSGRLTGSEEIPFSFEIDAARLAAGAAGVFTHRLDLHLERGEQRVAIGVWDELGGRGSFVSRAIAVGAGQPATAAEEGGR